MQGYRLSYQEFFTFFIGLMVSIVPVRGQEGPSVDSFERSGEEKRFRLVEHNAFQVGEKLRYKVGYGPMNAGVGTIELKETDKKVQGRDLIHASATGRSTGTFNWFFKVRDRYESYIDKKGVFPWIFLRRVNEGGYIINQDYVYYQHKDSVKTERRGTGIDDVKKGKFEIPDAAQDMISSFYYARTLDLAGAEKGEVFVVNCFMDEELYPLRIKYIGEETVKVKAGRFKCRKFRPVVQEGRVFKDNKDLTVWVTADRNNIPVLAKAKVLVGSIKMQLTGYEGLANSVARVD